VVHTRSPVRPAAPGSVGQHAAHAAAHTTSSVGVGRNVRFPSSRWYLWDRTPAAPQVLIDLLVSRVALPAARSCCVGVWSLASVAACVHEALSSSSCLCAQTLPRLLQDYLPQLQVAVSAFGAINRAAASGAATLKLQLSLSVASTHQVSALIQEHDPLRECDTCTDAQLCVGGWLQAAWLAMPNRVFSCGKRHNSLSAAAPTCPAPFVGCCRRPGGPAAALRADGPCSSRA
jgi:hypothetical protein